jgi:hypothetical protein
MQAGLQIGTVHQTVSTETLLQLSDSNSNRALRPLRATPIFEYALQIRWQITKSGLFVYEFGEKYLFLA